MSNSSHHTNSFIEGFHKFPSEKWVHNVSTQFDKAVCQQYRLPITYNNEEYDNSYVVSPYNALISYTKEELSKIPNPFFRIVCHLLTIVFSCVFKLFKINRVAMINNWLLSTNLYPKWSGDNLSKLTKEITNKYPNHVIMFRSLNHFHNPELIQAFQKNGYFIGASRQIYIFDKSLNIFNKRHNTKMDFKLLEHSDYQIIENKDIGSQDYQTIVKLYNMLYLEKYSYHNPQFTEHFIQYTHQRKILTFYGLKEKQEMVGIIGIWTLDKTMTVPIVGYDISLPQKRGIYRQLIALALQHGLKNQLSINLSSGASGFKRLRGGVPYIEYSAIYTKHLSFTKQLFWHLVTGVLNHIAVYILRKFEL